MNEPIKTAIAWLRSKEVVTESNRMYASEIADQTSAELARMKAQIEAGDNLADAIKRTLTIECKTAPHIDNMYAALAEWEALK